MLRHTHDNGSVTVNFTSYKKLEKDDKKTICCINADDHFHNKYISKKS